MDPGRNAVFPSRDSGENDQEMLTAGENLKFLAPFHRYFMYGIVYGIWHTISYHLNSNKYILFIQLAIYK